MVGTECHAPRPQQRSELVGLLAIAAHQQALSGQFGEVNRAVSPGQPMLVRNDETTAFGEEDPCVESIPRRVEISCHRDVDVALLQTFADLRGSAAQELELESRQCAHELGQMGDHKLHTNGG